MIIVDTFQLSLLLFCDISMCPGRLKSLPRPGSPLPCDTLQLTRLIRSLGHQKILACDTERTSPQLYLQGSFKAGMMQAWHLDNS